MIRRACASLLLAALAALAQSSPGTSVTSGQLRGGALTGVWVSHPTRGFTLARIDTSLVLEEVSGELVLRAVVPPVVLMTIVWRRESVLLTVPTTAFTLATMPSSSDGLFVFRNGLLQSDGVDYTQAGQVVTFKPGAAPQKDDLIVFRYAIIGGNP
jgi:hypothetical protein